MSLDWSVRWIVIAGLSIFDGCWLWEKGIGVELAPVTTRLEFSGAVLLVCVIITILARLWGNAAGDWIVLTASRSYFYSVAQMTCLLAPAATLSYLTASLKRPLADAFLSRADALLGFDWVSVSAWVASHPALAALLTRAYFSAVPQAAFVMFVGSVYKPADTNGDFLWSVMLSAVICGIVAGIVPAIGYDGLAGHAPIAALLDVRNGKWTSVNFDTAQGIVTFPSFHVALGILFPYAVRNVRWAFWLLVPLNIVMILSTPTVGGHYLIDGIAGCGVALVSIYLTRKIRGRIRQLGCADAMRPGKSPATYAIPIAVRRDQQSTVK